MKARFSALLAAVALSACSVDASDIGLLVGKRKIIPLIEQWYALQNRRAGSPLDTALLGQAATVLDNLEALYQESLTQPVSYIPIFFEKIEFTPIHIASLRAKLEDDRRAVIKALEAATKPRLVEDPRDPLVKLRTLGQELADQLAAGLSTAQEALRPLLTQDISRLNELLSGAVDGQDVSTLLKVAELIRGAVYNDTSVIQRYVLMHNAGTLFGAGIERDIKDPATHPVNLLKKRLWDLMGALRAIPERKQPLSAPIQHNLISDGVRLIRVLRPLTVYPGQVDVVQERLDDVITVLDAVINELSVNLAENREAAQALYGTVDVMAGAALGNPRLTVDYEGMRAAGTLFPDDAGGA